MIRDEIAQTFDLSHQYVAALIRTASHRYKRYRIPKQTGGWRTIDHPARQLKLIQKWLVRTHLQSLPVHDAVFSYRKNIGIRDHALVHLNNNYLTRADFRDFFPSIKFHDVEQLLKERLLETSPEYSRYDIADIARIACRSGKLTIGAPTSPILSNSILFDFDADLSKHCEALHVSYTRYADDMYFSTNVPNVLEELYKDLKDRVASLSRPKLRLNDKKTVFTSRKHERRVTGVVLTSDNRLSLGRERKRYMRSLMFKFTNKELDKELESMLRGYLAFAESIEPEFVTRLRQKFGEEAYGDLMQERNVSRK